MAIKTISYFYVYTLRRLFRSKPLPPEHNGTNTLRTLNSVFNDRATTMRSCSHFQPFLVKRKETPLAGTAINFDIVNSV